MTSETEGITSEEAARREAVMRDFTDRLNSDDIDSVLQSIATHCHSDIEWIEDPAWPGSSSVQGIGDVLALARERFEMMEFHQTIDRIVHAGDLSVGLMTWHGRGRASGAESELQHAQVATWREGKIARMQFIIDRDRALREAGIQDR